MDNQFSRCIIFKFIIEISFYETVNHICKIISLKLALLKFNITKSVPKNIYQKYTNFFFSNNEGLQNYKFLSQRISLESHNCTSILLSHDS